MFKAVLKEVCSSRFLECYQLQHLRKDGKVQQLKHSNFNNNQNEDMSLRESQVL